MHNERNCGGKRVFLRLFFYFVFVRLALRGSLESSCGRSYLDLRGESFLDKEDFALYERFFRPILLFWRLETRHSQDRI